MLLVHQLSESSTYYRGHADAFVSAIEQVLRVDVRSKDQTKRWTNGAATNHIAIDNANIIYSVVLSDALDADTTGDCVDRAGKCTDGPPQSTRVFIDAVSPVE